MAEHQGPICVSVINMKGGVGKTTIASLLAQRTYISPEEGEASRRAAKTLAIDLDPQANLSQALMGERDYKRFLESGDPSIVEVFKGYQPATQSTPSPRPLDIDDVVQEVRRNLHLIPSRFDFSDNLTGALRPDPRVLARLIADNFQDKELIIIDCAPTESVLTHAAYHASRYVLVPVKPEFFATIGFPLLNESIEKFKANNHGHQIDVLGVVINDMSDYQSYWAPETTTSREEIRKEANKNGWYVFRRQIRYSRGFPKTMRSIWGHQGTNALDIFIPFAREFSGRLGQLTGDKRYGQSET